MSVKESPQSETEDWAGRTNLEKKRDKTANVTVDILLHSLGEENKDFILSWVLQKIA